MRIFITLLLAAFLSGCAEIGALINSGEEYSRQALIQVQHLDDLALEANELGLCDQQKAGAIIRRYGGNKELLDAYKDFCSLVFGRQIEVPIIEVK